MALGIERWRYLGNVLFHRLSGREGPLNRGAWEKAFGRTVLRADVVHLHNAHGYYLPTPVLERILTRPTVWTLHDEWLLTGRCAFPLTCTGYRGGCRPCPYRGRYPAAWIDRAATEFQRKRRLAVRENMLFVTPSAAIRDRFLEAGFPADRFRVIRNPVEMELEVSVSARREARRELGFPEESKVALFVAAETWVHRKGIDVLATASRQLADPSAWQLAVVGAVNHKVRRLFSGHRMATRFAGTVDDRRLLAKYYLASDVLVVPSRNESFGLTVVEAMSMGCGVVCSDLPVFREILGDQGVYFPVEDDSACARAMKAQVDGSRPAAALEAARAIWTRFSLDRVTDLYLEVYETAREAGAGRRSADRAST